MVKYNKHLVKYSDDGFLGEESVWTTAKSDTDNNIVFSYGPKDEILITPYLNKCWKIESRSAAISVASALNQREQHNKWQAISLTEAEHWAEENLKMKKRILIDGSNVASIHRCSNAALDSNGVPVGVVKGFFSCVRNINRLFQPNEILVIFDGGGGSLQKRLLYKEYKEGRKPRTLIGGNYKYETEEAAQNNYDWQLSVLKKLLDCCGINVIETENFEGDDCIAYVLSLHPNDEHIIVSCDKDFYQLVTDKNKVYNPLSATGNSTNQQKGKLIGVEDIIKQFNIHPNNWLFYRAISGDKSDNIPGVKGFGPKTLQKLFLLNRDKSLQVDIISECVSVMEQVEKLSPSEKTVLKKLKTLEENKQLIERNWKLMDLRNVLMPSNAREKICFQLENFNPILKIKDFFIEVNKLGGIVSPTTVNEFLRLKNK